MHCNTHILIVDDIADNIQVAMNILKEDSYDFSFATQGSEAVELVEQGAEKFDLILLDVMMPAIDGFEVCKRLKENPLTSEIPVIFLTAKVDVDSISKGFSLGAVDYITKPFHADELLARTRNHIQLYRARRLLQRHNIALETKIEYEHKRLLTELEENQKEMIFMLTELMESTSDETGKHIRRVAEISALLARYHPALTEDDAEVLFHASPMHDIGKMTVPHEILHKPGRYTAEEFEAMKKHTSNAHELLCCSDRRLIKAAAIIAHEHHEKWDGSGYPRQLQGAEIHMYGRIVALADVFDALTHSRCYKTAWDMDEVIVYIQDQNGKHFDPELVAIFLEHIDEFEQIVRMT
ncbi:HD domain-containing phosphohydrolase [Methylomarinum vadi]|uniref:HD domain-containing phosphohydrolase n=1 Tax=Methylomarinum vadi TaxID=438855 RepID=UPI0004DF09DF|nr:HD domain-containing phosphohydrolase [Methylomarinum vadi]